MRKKGRVRKDLYGLLVRARVAIEAAALLLWRRKEMGKAKNVRKSDSCHWE